jgi:hypothetical protein
MRPKSFISMSLEIQRARERPGARCTRGLACDCTKQNCTRAYRFSGNTPAFPAQWLYGLLRAHPGERALLSPSPVRSVSFFTSLTPASRHQVHTTSPYASGHARQSQPSRPPLPAPRLRRWPTPLVGQDGGSRKSDLADGGSEIFSRARLDRANRVESAHEIRSNAQRAASCRNQARQFSTFGPRTRLNSSTLAVSGSKHALRRRRPIPSVGKIFIQRFHRSQQGNQPALANRFDDKTIAVAICCRDPCRSPD